MSDALSITSIDDLDPVLFTDLSREHQSPFFDFHFFKALESSGSITAETNWIPLHRPIEGQDGPLGYAPLYLKEDSIGDFAWDWNWAEASVRARIPYYPKLVATVPATPYGLYDVLAKEGDRSEAQRLLVDDLVALTDTYKIPSLQFLFPTPSLAAVLDDAKIPYLLHQKFLWQNYDYQSFDDFLARFDKNQRRNIKRERKAIRDAGIEIKVIDPNKDLLSPYIDLVWDCYIKTQDQFGPWAAKFLNKDFFVHYLSSDTKAPRIMLAMRDNKPIAMAFLMVKDGAMFGRYWGCLAEVEFLHFELCYYAPIEYAISVGVTTYDPGAGGEHKIRRGFEPVFDRAYHWSSNERFAQFFKQESQRHNHMLGQAVAKYQKEVPFKNQE